MSDLMPQIDEVEKLAEQWMRGAKFASLGVHPIWVALVAWLFLSVRSLGQRDWRFEFMADGVWPWDNPRSEM